MASHIRWPYVDWYRMVWRQPNQNEQATITLRSAGGLKLAQWHRGVTYMKDGTHDYKLYINGDTMLWLNNYSRRVKVQLTVKIGRDIVLAMKPVKIRAGEVYVLKPPLPIRADRKVTRSS